MRSLAIAALVVAIIVTGELALARRSNLSEWTRYKRQHGKVYETPQEEARRFSLFLAARDKIERHNAAANLSYELGLDRMSDWTQEELARHMGLGQETDKLELSAEAQQYLQKLMEDDTPVPAEVDWRKVPERVGSVRDAVWCGGSWAIAAVGVLEGQQVVRNYTKKLVDLSVQQLIDCSLSNFGCDNGYTSRALKDIAKAGGIESEHIYPFIAVDLARCKFRLNKIVMKVDGALDFPKIGEVRLQKLVAQYGPVAIKLSGGGLIGYRGGVLDDDHCKVWVGDLDVLVVGYGTDSKLGDYWIIKNVWGKYWGENGYVRLRRGKGTCGIGRIATIATWK